MKSITPKRLNRGEDYPPASWFNDLLAAVEANKILPSPNIRPKYLPQGTLLEVQASSTAGGDVGAGECILGDMQADPDHEGKVKLSTGFIDGGGSHEEIIIDNLTPIIDSFVWLAVSWTAIETDGVIMGGGTMGTVTPAGGATIPDDVIPSPGSLAGTAHINLGMWETNGATPPAPVWKNAGCGSIQLFFCPFTFFYTRGA